MALTVTAWIVCQLLSAAIVCAGFMTLAADRPCCCCAADKVFFSIALYMGDGGYQVVRMLIISYRHFMAVRRACKANGKYEDTSENSDALGLGIKLQARHPPPQALPVAEGPKQEVYPQ